MKLENQKPSKNFVDRTDDTEVQKFLTTIAVLLNPYTAAKNIGQMMRDKGILPLPPPPPDMFGRSKK